MVSRNRRTIPQTSKTYYQLLRQNYRPSKQRYKNREEELSNANASSNQVTEIRKTIIINQHLKRNKERKFYNLKSHQKNPRQNDNYLPQTQGQTNKQDIITTNQTSFSYASAVRRNVSNTNKRYRKKSPSRKNSYTNLTQKQRNQSREKPTDNDTPMLNQRIT